MFRVITNLHKDLNLYKSRKPLVFGIYFLLASWCHGVMVRVLTNHNKKSVIVVRIIIVRVVMIRVVMFCLSVMFPASSWFVSSWFVSSWFVSSWFVSSWFVSSRTIIKNPLSWFVSSCFAYPSWFCLHGSCRHGSCPHEPYKKTSFFFILSKILPKSENSIYFCSTFDFNYLTSPSFNLGMVEHTPNSRLKGLH